MKTRLENQGTKVNTENNNGEIEVDYDAKSDVCTVVSSSDVQGAHHIHCVVMVEKPKNENATPKKIRLRRRPVSPVREGRNAASTVRQRKATDRRSRSCTRQGYSCRELPPTKK